MWDSFRSERNGGLGCAASDPAQAPKRRRHAASIDRVGGWLCWVCGPLAGPWGPATPRRRHASPGRQDAELRGEPGHRQGRCLTNRAILGRMASKKKRTSRSSRRSSRGDSRKGITARSTKQTRRDKVWEAIQHAKRSGDWDQAEQLADAIAKSQREQGQLWALVRSHRNYGPGLGYMQGRGAS